MPLSPDRAIRTGQVPITSLDPNHRGTVITPITEGPRVLARLLDLLAAFDDRHPELSLSEVSRRSGLPVSTVHRFLVELERGGLVDRSPDGGYVVGTRLWQLGTLAPVHRELREAALPAMQSLLTATGADIALAVRSGLSAVYVERLHSRPGAAITRRPGVPLPLTSGAGGKALLAHADSAFIERVLADSSPVTAWTVTDPRRLRQELEAIRRTGIARSAQECVVGAAAVAVPVTNGARDVVAALVAIIPLEPGPTASLITRLQSAAAMVSRGLSPRPRATSASPTRR
jgi:DNA-binding IclR family transcriptional regulator